MALPPLMLREKKGRFSFVDKLWTKIFSIFQGQYVQL